MYAPYDLRDEMYEEVKENMAKTLENTRQVTHSLLRRWISQNLRIRYSMLVDSGLKISHSDIVRLCGTSPAKGNKWFNECDKGLPGIEQLTALSMIFGCTIYDLIKESATSLKAKGSLPDCLQNPLSIEQISAFKSECARLNSALRQQIGRNLNFQYALMLSHGEKINHAKIARMCGVSRSTAYRWFNNCERLPGIDDLTILSFIFGCKISELIEDTGVTETQNQGESSSDSYPDRPYTERLKDLEWYYCTEGDQLLMMAWGDHFYKDYFDYD